MVKARMLPNGQFIITLPSMIIKGMNIKDGDSIEFKFDRGEVYLRKE